MNSVPVVWKEWDDQGELKKLIRDCIDTGCDRSVVCDQIESENPNELPKD